MASSVMQPLRHVNDANDGDVNQTNNEPNVKISGLSSTRFCGHCFGIGQIQKSEMTISCSIDQVIDSVINRELSNIGYATEAEATQAADPVVVDEAGVNPCDNGICLIAYDLETNGPWAHAEIVHIGAISNDSTFERFIMPDSKITQVTTKLTGFEKEVGQNGETVLKRNGAVIPTVPYKQAMADFVKFLETERARYHDSAIMALIAHNGAVFDAPKVIRALQRAGLHEHPVLDGLHFGDSMRLAKKLRIGHPTSLWHGYYGLKRLSEIVLPSEDYEAHTALGDAGVVLKLTNALFLQYPYATIVNGLDLTESKRVALPMPNAF